MIIVICVIKKTPGAFARLIAVLMLVEGAHQLERCLLLASQRKTQRFYPERAKTKVATTSWMSSYFYLVLVLAPEAPSKNICCFLFAHFSSSPSFINHPPALRSRFVFARKLLTTSGTLPFMDYNKLGVSGALWYCNQYKLQKKFVPGVTNRCIRLRDISKQINNR